MADLFSKFESIVRKSHFYSDEIVTLDKIEHPFLLLNIHEKIPIHVKNLFDDGYYSQSTFEAFKYLDKEIARISNQSESGYKLMMSVFSEKKPLIKLNDLSSTSDKDEQKGFQFIFAGSIIAIRNPRGHEYKIVDDIDQCLDYLNLVSLLIRRIEKAGYKFEN